MKQKIFENGLTLAFQRKKELPITHFYLAIKAGSIYDPPGQEGLAFLTASLTENGTKNRSEIEIAIEIDKLGTTLSISVGQYIASLQMTVLSEKFKEALDIISEIVKEPSFPEKAFYREKNNLLSSIQSELSTPNGILRRALNREIYKGTFLEHPPDGYLKSVEKIQIHSVFDFYKMHWIPEKTLIAIVSDREFEEVAPEIEKRFGEWRKKALKIEKPEKFNPEVGPQLVIYNLPVSQAFIGMGHLAPKRKIPEYNALRVANFVLGGGVFLSRLMNELRIKYGLVYDVLSHISFGLNYPGNFYITLATKLENTTFAIERTLEIINDLIKNGIKKEELEKAKSYYKGYLPRRFVTYPQVANTLMNILLHKLPEDYWKKDFEEIQNLQKEKVDFAIKKYINPEEFKFVIVGDIKKLEISSLENLIKVKAIEGIPE